MTHPEPVYGMEAHFLPAHEYATIMEVSIPVKENGKVVGYEPGYEITVARDADEFELFTLTPAALNRLLTSVKMLTGE